MQAGESNSPENQFIQEQMMNPSVVKTMESMPAEERAAYMRKMFQDYQGMTDLNKEAMSQADALRQQGGPEGVRAGNQYVAASPLSHMASAGQNFMANRDANAAREAQKQLVKDRSEGTAGYAAMQGGLPTEGLVAGDDKLQRPQGIMRMFDMTPLSGDKNRPKTQNNASQNDSGGILSGFLRGFNGG